MTKILISKRSFSLEDQRNFADFSGDFNPIHLSDKYARKTPPGKPIVHGINTFLWALDGYCESENKFYEKINIKFLQPIYLNEEIFCYFYPKEKKLEVCNNNIIFLTATFNGAEYANKRIDYNKTPEKIEINEYDINDIDSMLHSNELLDFSYTAKSELIQPLYPNLHKNIAKSIICEMGCLSAIVGMQLPGLHSIFVSLKIDLINLDQKAINTVEIVKADKRFNIVDIKASSANITSIIRAIVRPKPIKVLSSNELKESLELEKDFNKKILVIGGSRGLGSIVVKILSLLGCSVTFTYSKGKEEALNLKEELLKSGKNVQFIKCDINEPNMTELFLSNPEYIFYFPTPKIFVKRSKTFEEPLYKIFYFYYVDFFTKIFNKSVEHSVSGIFYPSSIAIEEDSYDMPEYVKAKTKGEALCGRLKRKNKVNILMKRLPRTLTDQTSTNLDIKSETPFDVMMPIIKEFLN
jgi:hypothetical protein